MLAVKAPTDYLEKGPESRGRWSRSGMLGGLVLLLAGTPVLLRKKEKEPEENSGTEAAAEHEDRAHDARGPRAAYQPSACARRLISVAGSRAAPAAACPGSVSSGVVSQRSDSSAS